MSVPALAVIDDVEVFVRLQRNAAALDSARESSSENQGLRFRGIYHRLDG